MVGCVARGGPPSAAVGMFYQTKGDRAQWVGGPGAGSHLHAQTHVQPETETETDSDRD